MGVNNDWNPLLTLNGSVSNTCSLTSSSHHPQRSAVGPSYPLTFLVKPSSQTRRTLAEGHSCFLMQQQHVPENCVRHCREASLRPLNSALSNNGPGLVCLSASFTPPEEASHPNLPHPWLHLGTARSSVIGKPLPAGASLREVWQRPLMPWCFIPL